MVYVYADDALVAAAKLTDRYINDRFLPDKPIMGLASFMMQSGKARHLI